MSGATKVAPSQSAEVEARLLLKIGSEIIFVAASEIECVMSEGNYLHMMTSTRKYFVRGVISALELMLPGQEFLRVHRTTLLDAGR